MNFKDKKSKIIISILAILLIAAAAGFAIWRQSKKPAENQNHPPEDPKDYYEAMLQTSDQKLDDPAEDQKYSLKAGDVFIIFPGGHGWSDSERADNLIIKLKITPEEAQELTEPVEKGTVDEEGEKTPKLSAPGLTA